jgi:hypothetical protein
MASSRRGQAAVPIILAARWVNPTNRTRLAPERFLRTLEDASEHGRRLHLIGAALFAKWDSRPLASAGRSAEPGWGAFCAKLVIQERSRKRTPAGRTCRGNRTMFFLVSFLCPSAASMS